MARVEDLTPGTVVEWDTWCGVATGRVMRACSDHVSLATPADADGWWAHNSRVIFADCFRSLADRVAHLRVLEDIGTCDECGTVYDIGSQIDHDAEQGVCWTCSKVTR